MTIRYNTKEEFNVDSETERSVSLI